MQACDLGEPVPQCVGDNALVRVQVGRNLNQPIFENDGFYTATIEETRDIESRAILKVKADDEDEVSVNDIRSLLVKSLLIVLQSLTRISLFSGTIW